MTDALILGCGFTGKLLARRLAARGVRVLATSRNPASLAGLPVTALHLEVLDPASLAGLRRHLTPGIAIVHSIPVAFDPKALGSAPSRIVYLSTTGVYGDAFLVDETTPACPITERQRLRFHAEEAIRATGISNLTLRAAAIYGRGRGVHETVRRRLWDKLDQGSNYISRIHGEDLAAHAEAALFSNLEGAWPVADDEPCTARAMAEFCSRLLEIPLPPEPAQRNAIDETRRADRRVDGRAIRYALAITLQYPTYREGVPASAQAV